MRFTNELLTRTAIRLRAGQTGFWDEYPYGIRLSKHRGRPEAGLWFRTRGCRFAHMGSCVMCDYGKGPSTTQPADMIESVRQGLAALPAGLYHLLVSPIGSFCDTWEVPVEARREILKLMAGSDVETFAFETRADTVTAEVIEECVSLLNSRSLKIYLGLESADPWVSQYCINKALPVAAFEHAVQILRKRDVFASANVLLGAPFLTPRQAIADVLRSVAWAFAKGANECNLFPTHVKEWTVLRWLSDRGIYDPPSLWSLVEILRRLGPDVVCTRIKFSWYKTYGSDNVVRPSITCQECWPEVIYYLDQFYETNDYDWVQRLVSHPCRCKDAWRAQLEAPDPVSPLTRAADAYKAMGLQVLGEDWWRRYGDGMLQQMLEDERMHDMTCR